MADSKTGDSAWVKNENNKYFGYISNIVIFKLLGHLENCCFPLLMSQNLKLAMTCK